MTPNPSFHPTCYGWLSEPTPPGELRRWASPAEARLSSIVTRQHMKPSNSAATPRVVVIRTLSLVTLFLLVGCAPAVPFGSITIGGEPTVRTTKHATISPISTEDAPPRLIHGVRNPEFDKWDQADFVEVLQTELMRLRVFQSMVVGSREQAADFHIDVNFVRTRWVSRATQRYELLARMTIEGGRTRFVREYYIDTEKDALWESVRINAYQAKARGVKLLLESLIPDIQAYVSANCQRLSSWRGKLEALLDSRG